MIITLYDKEKHKYSYSVTENYIVEPNETWVLDDFGDNRILLSPVPMTAHSDK